MADQNIADKPQTKPGQQQQPQGQAGQQQNRPMGQQPQGGDKGDMQSPDQGLVGQDTDGDGKVVKPGQAPGQSHGKGLDK
jgi:hypothetical protein